MMSNSFPTLSFKGITWAGNVYQKFEAMCLEVEEAMYQDTVKYVENQAQKVGVSVKKFCSEVMEDMHRSSEHPPSCIDPTGATSDDMSLISYGYADVNKKPTPGILGDNRDIKKKDNQDQVLSTTTAEKGSLPSDGDIGLFLPQSPGIYIENKSPEKFKKIGIQRRGIGIKRISKSNNPSKDLCLNNSVSEDKRSKLANCETRTRSRATSDSPRSMATSNNTDLTPSLDSVGRCEPGKAAVKGNAQCLDHPIESPASDKILSSESVRPDSSRVAPDDSTVPTSLDTVRQQPGEAVNGNTAPQDNLIERPASKKVLETESTRKIEHISDCVPPASENNLTDESVRLEGDPESTASCSCSPADSTGASVNDIVGGSGSRSKACSPEYEENGVTVFSEGTYITDCLSTAISPSCNAESSNKDLITTTKDSFDKEFVENNKVSELRQEPIETDECRDDLEESCIFVNGDELHFDLQGTRKHKSYKKRIREAISSKLRSRKDEQHVPSQGEQERCGRARARARADDSKEQKLSACECVESDWELL
ncbi:uncharacterized protein LOC121806180 [Salvia splendens]|uniref:uncharacterized protein LOC121806180 n=1 Tax=Salvia splendens TaxID=180675 RepID=UPI001C2707CD|nr:uncharacterized protein LOC121806180 [Salvia splendens]XP_042062061.1 uncharacterized protein LOC121806180 [Salvia splendens]